MSTLIRFLGFLVSAVVLPVLTGLLPLSFLPADKREFHLLVPAGYFTSFALFELTGLPVLFLTWAGNFKLLVVLYLLFSLAVIAAGAVRCAKSGGIRLPRGARILLTRMGKLQGKKALVGEKEAFLFWLIFLCILGVQLYMALTRASYDGDDAYYVAQSLQAYQTGTMYNYVPYTGVSTTLDGRHALAMIPMWIAAVSKLCRTHPTIITHTMLPLVFLVFADICLYSVSKELLVMEPELARRRMLPAMMILFALLQIFGNVSIYTPETFLMMRTWQGKTVFANMVLPSLFWLLLVLAHRSEGMEYAEEGYGRFPYIMLVLVNIASGFCTSLAPLLCTGLLLAGSLFIRIFMKQKKAFGRVLLCCIPNILYSLFLVFLMLPVLRGGA